MKRRNLLLVNQSAGPLTWEFAEDYAANYGRVDVFTGHKDAIARDNAGEVYVHKGVTYDRGTYLRRVYTWIVFCLQAVWWLLGQDWHSTILFYSNPPFGYWIGRLLKQLTGRKYAVMVHDVYPDALKMVSVSPSHPVYRFWLWMNRIALRNASAVLTLGEVMASNLEYQIAPCKRDVAVIYPWVDAIKIRPIVKSTNPFARMTNQIDKLTVMYSGNMGLTHDLDTLLNAANRLQGEADISFLLIGNGPKRKNVEEFLRLNNPTNVILLDYVSEDTFPNSQATADIAIVSIEPRSEGVIIPSKAMSALAAGAGVIAICGENNELAHWIDAWRIGKRVAPGDVDGLAKAICYYRDHPDELIQTKQYARNSAERYFNRTTNSTRMTAIIAEV